MLDAGTQIDAVFDFNDTLAMGAMHVLLRNGRQVPEDVAVIGFDNIEETRFSMPPLTSVDPGRMQIASTAVNLLTNKIDGRGATAKREIYADFTLEARESTIGWRQTSGHVEAIDVTERPQ